MKIMTKKIIKAAAPTASAAPVHLVQTEVRVLNKKALEAKAQADEILQEAAAEAATIRAKAQAVLDEVEGVRAAARTEGFHEGREAGMAAATEFALRVQEWKATFYRGAEPEIIRLVMTIAEKVIGTIVQEHSEAIRAIVRQAIESSLGDRIVVRLNPEDYRVITAQEFAYRDILDRTKRLTFKEDAAITKGGCVVETEVGTIDAQLETQLEAIRKALEL
ncbi:MAG: hypothetical protein HYV03_06770 [Deltaproteobacteria bacterium]|nr:hypothetical protein [Deltaproteobacteria bacterium]